MARLVARIRILPADAEINTDDVAKAISFFCSLDAAYITGQTLNVDGGMEMD